MESNLIVVRQLPEIEEHLLAVKEDIENRVAAALAMPCTEETLTAVKKERAALNKEFSELEQRRKEVKAAILAPYEAFEDLYRQCAADIYRGADGQLKARVGQVEDGIKQEKLDKVTAYFQEYREAIGVPEEYARFERSGVKITMSASLKSLKEAVKAYLDQVSAGLALINTQEGPEEILLEYRATGNAACSITAVKRRREAVEEEKRRREELAAQARAREEASVKAQEAAREWAAPVEVEASEPVVEDHNGNEPRYTLQFTVKNVTKAQAKALRDFLKNGGYDYE